MKRKIIAAAAAALVGLSLTACASPYEADFEPDQDSDDTTVQVVELPDGREVVCVMWDPSATGVAMDCNWEGLAR
jgi:hypothetical protein